MISESVLKKLRELLPGFLSGKRLSHTYAVEEECRALSALFTAFPMLFSEDDALRLRAAALLHDITKQKTPEEQLALCKLYKIPLTDYEKATPKVLHAKTAPAFAKANIDPLFGFCLIDGAVADAIRTHTTGSAHMSLMGKLLFLADYIEPTRTFPDCVLLRERFWKDIDSVKNDPAALSRHLDETLVFSFDLTIRDLLDSHALIDPETTAARNALLYSLTETTPKANA